MMRPYYRKSTALVWLISVLLLSASARAVIRVSRPPSTQLPLIARFAQPYNVTFAPDTFVDVNATAPFTYTADNLPAWATFEAATLSISGIPARSSRSRTNDSITLTATNPKTQSAASTLFHLITLPGRGPLVNKPLAAQLPNVSSLGSEYILPSGAQLLPLGWSFALAFAGDTFLSDSNDIYISAQLKDGSPLPGWMHFDQMTLFGVAPTDVHSAGEFYIVVVTASDLRGYRGVQSEVRLVVSGASIVLGAPLQALNATAGQPFTGVLALEDVVDTRGRAIDGSHLRVTANTSAVGEWLAFDEATRTFSGMPPFNITEAEPLSLIVPLTLVNTASQRGTPVPVTVNITIHPSPFAVWSLPDVRLAPGRLFQLDLGSYLRSTRTPPQVTVEPASASKWIHFDPLTRILFGTPPSGGFEPVQVQLSIESRASDGFRDVSSETFTMTQLDSPPVGSPDGLSSADAGASGLSSKARIAIAASLGCAGGLVVLALLVVYCHRHCTASGHVQKDGRDSDCEKSPDRRDDDDRTLADERSPRFGWASLKDDKLKDISNPYVDPSAAFSPTRSPISDAPTLAASDEGRSPRSSDVTSVTAPPVIVTTAPPSTEKPQRSPLLAQLARSPSSIQRITADAQADLARPNGLGLEGIPQRDLSQMTVRDSWESDLFYDDAEVQVPVRREVRQRIGHLGASPRFELDTGFEVGYARKVSLDTTPPPKHVSVLQGQRILSQHSVVLRASRGSSELRTRTLSQATQDEDIFEDAEDDPSAAVRASDSTALHVPEQDVDSRRSSATLVRTSGRTRDSEDEERGLTVRAIRSSIEPVEAPLIPGAGTRATSVARTARSQTAGMSSEG
ncbi:Cadherin-like protein [Kalmanozyma brasiliensis GHG001]|uniref:Cadherin-like protein n=1 Tax=Kalmanozyma brasiliensis (strain GHG001) TaxID=1365824 RepID=UPI002867E1F9|nr:Cadherin-like protein [Kalmanozyma brasiliensis GHG001]KAF6767326.1 Cadherin-like protein [Kalmanozyma brasiliensis GHG001]